MTKWKIQFLVNGEQFESTMAKLMPMQLQELGFSIVEDLPPHKDQFPLWEQVAELTTREPRPLKSIYLALEQSGVPKGSQYNAVNKACEHRVVRKVSVKGVPHLVREKVK